MQNRKVLPISDIVKKIYVCLEIVTCIMFLSLNIPMYQYMVLSSDNTIS